MSLPETHSRFRSTLPLLSTLTLVTTLAAVWLLYAAAYAQERRDKERLVNTLAGLAEAVARFDQQFSQADNPTGSRGATLGQLATGLGQTLATKRDGEEIVIGDTVAGRLQVLRATQDGRLQAVASFAWDSTGTAAPLRRALRGENGVMEALDYRGTPVLAAYAPIPTIRLGLVAKTDLSAVRAPFIRAALLALGVYAVVLLLLEGILRRRSRALTGRLEASERYLASLTNLAPVLIVVLTPAGDIEYLNPSFEELTGWRLAEVEGKEWFSTCLPERDRDRVRQLFRSAAGGTPTRGNVNAIVTRSGEERLIEWHDDGGQRTAGGALMRLLVVGIDVTDVYAARAEALSNYSRLNEAQRVAKVGSWELDLATGALAWSDEIFRMFEIDPARFGATYEAFLGAIHPDDRDAVNAAYSRSLVDRQPYEITHRLQMRDGRIKHVEERGESAFDAAGNARRSVGTVQDITDRALAEQRIEKQLREKESLLREIHHRVKNNLNVISSLLYLQSTSGEDERVRALFGKSRDRVQAMALVHDLLYQSGDLAHIDFGAYLGKLTSTLQEAHGDVSRRVVIENAVAVPPLDVSRAVPCGLIVSELITNALRHAFVGRSSGAIQVALTPLGAHRVRLTVRDDGVGATPLQLQPAHKGALGLRLVHALADQLGGTIEVTSGADGTAFTLDFDS